MTTIEDDRGFIDPATVSVFPMALRVGLIGGLIIFVYEHLGLLTNFTDSTSGFNLKKLYFILWFQLVFGILIYAINKHRDQDLGGYISFGRILLLGLIIFIVEGLFIGIANYIYLFFIEPDHIQAAISETEGNMANFGLSEIEMKMALEKVEELYQPLNVFMYQFLRFVVVGIFITMIFGFVMKKRHPNPISK